MTQCDPTADLETHAVRNQPQSRGDGNLWADDTPLREIGTRVNMQAAALDAYGHTLGQAKMRQAARDANRNDPELCLFDSGGRRLDEVRFHPTYHQFMQTSATAGYAAVAWEGGAGAHATHAAMVYMASQVEPGHCCPLTMTYASIPVIAAADHLATDWHRKLTARDYDRAIRPVAEKRAATLGMAMTEKQGGTDVRANTTHAHPVGICGPGQAYELLGHKWFCSAPMCDAFLTLAQTDKGLSCFLLPRHRPDGSRNQFYIQRLKNKLGNCANASSEVEFRGALAWMVGAEGRGVPTIIEMVSLTRFDCMIGSSSLMRQALTQAAHHCAHRTVGARVLSEQPLMQNVLADLALESEAALALTMRMGKSLDNAHNEHEEKFARLVTAIGKYWICKRAPGMINEAQECLGGAGYVEDSILPRLYREAPVNSIWEGSGNVQCLDVLRALSKEPGVLDVLFAELGDGHGSALLKQRIEQLKQQFSDTDEIQYRARQLTEDVAVALQARLLLEAGNATVSDAFIASRLGQHGQAYGTLPRGLDLAALVARSSPASF